jgi:hypothetical protein
MKAYLASFIWLYMWATVGAAIWWSYDFTPQRMLSNAVWCLLVAYPYHFPIKRLCKALDSF